MIFANKSGGSPQHFRQMYDKKVNLLGLISLITLPEEATPPTRSNCLAPAHGWHHAPAYHAERAAGQPPLHA